MSNERAIEYDKQHVWHHLTQHKTFESSDPLIIVEANGLRIKDAKGVEYLDATSGGVWTVNVGYGRKSIVDAVSKQLLKMPYFAGVMGSVPGANYAKTLIGVMPGLNRVYYSNSGSEANEKAYKIARQRAHFYNKGKKHKIIFRDRDYHGTTIGALSSTGHFQRKNQYGPFAPGFIEMEHCCCYRCPFGKKYDSCNIECAHALEKIILKEGADNVGLVVLEPITAGGGIVVPVAEYFPIIQKICKKYDVLLHIDEVVCGLGRTGKWFGYQNFDVRPDIVTAAKGVAGGYAAISLTITSEEVFSMFKADLSKTEHYFRDISTFGGCTAGPAAALETFNIINNENLLDNVQKMGNYLNDKLLGLQDKHQAIGDVRGKGLIMGLELVNDRKTKEPMSEQLLFKISGHCLANKVIIGRTNRSFNDLNNVLILSPAFICTKEDINIIVDAIDKALTECV